MTFGRRADPTSSGSTGIAASWERNSSNGAAGRTAARARGALTVAASLAFLRENARRILTLALAIFAFGAVVLLVIPTRYAATALVVVDPREQRITTEQDVLPGIGQDSAALQSLVEVAKSDGFLKPLIEELKVRDDPDLSGGYTDPARLLERFRNRLDISRRGLTYVIAFRFTSNRSERAAYYANAIAEAFVARQSRIRSEATDEAADWLGGRLKTLSDRLKASEDAVAAFKLEHRIVNAGKDATTQQLRVTELSQQVAAARVRTEEAKARYEQAQRDVKANVESPVRQDLLSALRAQRSALNDQIAQKRAVLGDRHPDLVMSYGQLNDLNRQIEVERKKGIDTAKSEYEAQRDQQKALESQMKAAESQLLVDGQALVKLQELQRDAEANRNIYEQFLSRSKTTNEQRLLQSSQTKVASLAIPPLRSTLPPLPLLLAALAIGSLLTSTAVVVATGRGPDKSVPDARDPEPAPRQAEAWPRPPVWTRIPDLVPAEAPRNIWQGPVSAVELDLGPHLLPLFDRLEKLPGSLGKVVLVMSVGKRAGGNTVARSLNRWAVNRGKLSVLIRVEPDLGGAKIASAMGPADGMTTADFRSVDELLSAGRLPQPSPADDIRSEFDLIIVHATSLALQPEVAALAAHTDLVVLVGREDAIDSAAMRRVTAALSRFGGVPTGIVVNHVPADPSSAQRRGEALGLVG
ncbi:GumC family protein [Bradyrhizobium sp. CCGE-LA001]|uniref:GumC family protein n=1 Tax=Bradyrhizobium sp. CCGE-LA001 TaxID=1223566 RepID=UPI0002AA7EAF|nr:GumC family protein [Bradyrhizobium sp. CCGE-LA001]AMA57423.1 lipopolysaccharide biosynthesis protein [Bradyrhizobium sp. CCGE-LA001]